jgi:hypothetical protein
MRKLTLSIHYDQDATESPNEWGGWALRPFNSRYRDSVNINDYLERGNDGKLYPANIGIRRKLTVGTLFLLSCYEHSGSVWSLFGGGPPWDRQWDYTYYAGVLEWQDATKYAPKGREARLKSALQWLEMYNNWANGRVFGYNLEELVTAEYEYNGEKRTKEVKEFIDSCWGFIGGNGMDAHINESLQADDLIIVKGDARELVDSLKLKGTIVDSFEED